ncbi:enoyl-ACP reductase FabI [Spongiivirga citrea]|uniref:SDR family oxidoreductase n=1 Tax=Spongiivirga citrea TaxID=1481457 RepID=A0A6M0CFG0_9FLAO|nr:SDR family oxidoreductase [Spongiivirga citrea]NER15623.1 SDR family oxidoreductase [Spongiivirga citrea]
MKSSEFNSENTNNWAVILGGSTGLGYATALKLAQHGLQVCIVHRNARTQMTEIENNFQKIKEEGVELLSFNIDATNVEKRQEVIQQFVDKNISVKVLIHSIAKGNLKPMLSDETTTLANDDFKITIDAMAISLYDWVKSISDNELFSQDARVVSFTSEGSQKAWKNYAAVSAAKSALEAITRNIALEFASKGIRANCIQAGVTDTTSLRMISGSEELIEHTKKRNPFNRLTRPEDVANGAYLLCKKEAAWINGTIIKVDGGEHIS